MDSKFQIGDKVRLVKDTCGFEKGTVGEVISKIQFSKILYLVAFGESVLNVVESEIELNPEEYMN